jgi:hypothetical protein
VHEPLGCARIGSDQGALDGGIRDAHSVLADNLTQRFDLGGAQGLDPPLLSFALFDLF